jgi:hypothetical protein
VVTFGDPSLIQDMKPTCHFTTGNRRFPLTDYFFQSGFGEWRGYSSPHDDESHRFHNLSREFLLESAREQKKEMFVFALVVLTAAWPIIYMVVTVVQLWLRGQGLAE